MRRTGLRAGMSVADDPILSHHIISILIKPRPINLSDMQWRIIIKRHDDLCMCGGCAIGNDELDKAVCMEIDLDSPIA